MKRRLGCQTSLESGQFTGRFSVQANGVAELLFHRFHNLPYAGYPAARPLEPRLAAVGSGRAKVLPFIPPDKTRRGVVLSPAPKDRIPSWLSPADRMRRKLRTQKGRKRYGLRMGTVEPVLGQIKHGRGFRQFLLLGQAEMVREWQLICIGHNLPKLFTWGRKKARTRGALALS